jgi:tungstate transport system permease protein
MNDAFSAVAVSLSVSIASTALCAVVGIPAGCALAMIPLRGKGIVLGMLNTLLSLPTVVVGLLVFLLICRGSIFGDLHLLFTPWAMILGQFVLALPIMTVFSHSALNNLDKAVAETARMLGAGHFDTAITIIREAKFGIMAAVAATFGRLVGEVGIAMMLGGNIAGYTRTMTTTIALETSKGELSVGLKLGCILLMIALIVNIGLRHLQGRAAHE